MVFCITLLHAGILPALFVFFIWSLPGAIGMYALSLGVQKVNEVLPKPVYALLSGLNASTVGIIALAAVQLACKAITDPLTRILVIISACAGLCYNALWYFPVIMVIGGLATLVWDHLMRSFVARLVRRLRNGSNDSAAGRLDEENEVVPMEDLRARTALDQEKAPTASSPEAKTTPRIVDNGAYKIPVKIGLFIIAVFLCTFPFYYLTPANSNFSDLHHAHDHPRHHQELSFGASRVH
jgi:chromate transport protein ChrA